MTDGLSAEIHVAESERGDEFLTALPGVRASGQKAFPQRQEIARHDHAAHRAHYLPVFEEIPLHAIGEVARGAVRIAAVEVGDEDAGAAEAEDGGTVEGGGSFGRLRMTGSVLRMTGKGLRMTGRGQEGHHHGADGIFPGRGHAQLRGHVGVEEVFLHHAVLYDCMLPGGDSLRIEQAAAVLALDVGTVQHGEPGGEDLLPQRPGKEGIVLLDVVAVQGRQDRREDLGCHLAVHHHVVFSSPGAL